jgi:hypothetical protein
MISRQIGPTAPAGNGAERSVDASDSVAVGLDGFRPGEPPENFAIGITPGMWVSP